MSHTAMVAVHTGAAFQKEVHFYSRLYLHVKQSTLPTPRTEIALFLHLAWLSLWWFRDIYIVGKAVFDFSWVQTSHTGHLLLQP